MSELTRDCVQPVCVTVANHIEALRARCAALDPRTVRVARLLQELAGMWDGISLDLGHPAPIFLDQAEALARGLTARAAVRETRYAGELMMELEDLAMVGLLTEAEDSARRMRA